jgi:hypothetical protein
MTTIPELTEHHTDGMCTSLRFCAAAPPFCRPAPTDERGLGPLISVWVRRARGGHKVPRLMVRTLSMSVGASSYGQAC